jgi:ABC-type antimicrobial peptide transport system permease subunit
LRLGIGSLRQVAFSKSVEVTFVHAFRYAKATEITPAVFVPYTLLAPPDRMIAIRTQGERLLLLNSVRQRIDSLNKELPLSRPSTLDDVPGQQTVQPRFNAALFTFLAGLGLSLAALGVYSVLSYTVARRAHEIGIRMPLGATRGDVLALISGMGTKLVAVGLSIGLAVGLTLVRLLNSGVFDVPATEPWSVDGDRGARRGGTLGVPHPRPPRHPPPSHVCAPPLSSPALTLTR